MTIWYLCPRHGVIIDDATDYGFNEEQDDGQYRHEEGGCGEIVTEMTPEESDAYFDQPSDVIDAIIRSYMKGKHA